MKYIFLFPLLFASAIAQGQSVNYDLNSYKYRFQEYRLRQYNVNLSSNGFVHHYRSREPGNPTNTGSSVAFNPDFSGSGWYFRSRNTENLQQTVTMGMQAGYSGSSYMSEYNRQQTRTDIHRQGLASAYARLEQRKYRQLKFSYLNISASGYGQLEGNRNNIAGTSDQLKRGTLQLSLHRGFGNGRLENISDASFAMFWLADMQANGIIEQYHADQIEALAKTITRVRNTRIIDFRFRTRDQVKMYDSFFQQSGLVRQCNADYFTTLFDHYLYANNYQRFSGRRITWSAGTDISIMPGTAADRTPVFFSRTARIDAQAPLLLSGALEKQWALNLHYDRNMSLGVAAGVQLNYFNEFSRQINDDHFSSEGHELPAVAEVNYSQGITRYFDTRSYLKFNVHCRARTIHYRDGWTMNAQLEPSLNYFYWFNPNWQLGIDARVNGTQTFDVFTGNPYRTTNYNIIPSVSVRLNYTVF